MHPTWIRAHGQWVGLTLTDLQRTNEFTTVESAVFISLGSTKLLTQRNI